MTAILTRWLESPTQVESFPTANQERTGHDTVEGGMSLWLPNSGGLGS